MPNETSERRLRVMLRHSTLAAFGLSAIVALPAPSSPQVPPEAPDTVPDWLYSAENTRLGSACITGHMLRAIVVVTFEEGTPLAKKQEAVDRVDGRVVGGLRPRDDLEGYYYVRVDDDPEGRSLCEAVEALDALPQVALATEALFQPRRRGDFGPGEAVADTVCRSPVFVGRTSEPSVVNGDAVRRWSTERVPALLDSLESGADERPKAEDAGSVVASLLDGIRMLVCVDERGMPRAVDVRRGDDARLVRFARRLAMRMRFSPAKWGEEPRAVWIEPPFGLLDPLRRRP